MTLAETQALLHRAITAPGSVPAARLEACVGGTAALPGADRVAIYAGMYRARLTEALRQTFPLLARHLGDERFAALADDYLRRHPSRHHDIARAGERLPAFLRRHPDPARPDLADLAALEWARQEVFFAPAAAAVGPAALAGLDAAAFASTGLAITPALRVLVLAHDVLPLWRSLEDGQSAAPPAPGPSAAAAWRVDHQVVHAALDLDEAQALQGALRGEPLAAICAAFADRPDPAAAAHQALASWLAEGWISGLSSGRPP